MDPFTRLADSSGRIAVCSWTLSRADPRQVAERAKRLEIPRVQLALSPVASDPAEWGEAPSILRNAGVTIVSGMMAMAGEDYSTLESIARTGGLRPDSTWPMNLEHARRVAQIAAENQIPLVTFHAGFIPEGAADPARSKLLDRLRVIADIFQDQSVRIALETGQESARTLQKALDDLERPGVGVNFDPANMILYGKGDPVQALRTLSHQVCQVHVKDAMASPVAGQWGREVRAGAGQVRWADFFQAALAIDPPVAFVIEREARNADETDLTAARDLIAYHLSRSPSRAGRL